MVPFGRRKARTRWGRRGQSLVEFALLLPLMMLVILIALDFGRSFLAWVNLNNATRLAANYASLHPTAWGDPGNATYRTEYSQMVINDFGGMGCAPPNPVPVPVFAASTGLGDPVAVTFHCDLPLLTPMIGSFFPSTGVPITATSVFPIRGGIIPGAGCAIPIPQANFAITFPADMTAPATILVTNTTTGIVNAWEWNFGDGAPVYDQNPISHKYNSAGTYSIQLKATNGCGGTIHTSADFTIVPPALPVVDFDWNQPDTTPCPGSRLQVEQGSAVVFCARSSGGTQPITDWKWTIDGAAVTLGNIHVNPSVTGSTYDGTYTFGSDGTFTVRVTVTDSVGETAYQEYSVTVAPKTCTVPNFVGAKTSQVQKLWNDAGFATTVNFTPYPPPTYTVARQTQTAGAHLRCDTTQVGVSNP